MTKTTLLLAALAILLPGAPPADATLQTIPIPPFNVTVKKGYATGNMAAVRNGSYPKESVSCGQSTWASGVQYATCYMIDANGVTGGCRVFDDMSLATLRSIKPDSQITLTWNDGELECSSIVVSDWSGYAPKAP